MTYPNILILDYLKRTKKATPDVQMKAEQLISLGYQRLLTFETPGGGFDWFGNGPAKTGLTAYGLLELTDMARVATVDEGLLQRAKGVLLQRQRPDGSWPIDGTLHSWSGMKGELPMTAYVTWALAHAGGAAGAVESGLAYLEPRLDEGTDAYVLALAANAFARAKPTSRATRRVLDLLASRKGESAGAVSWSTPMRTLTYGHGNSAQVETTALAAQAFIAAGYRTDAATGALTYLVRERTASGSWSTTQATILALQALVAGAEGIVERGNATVRVQVNGREAAVLRVNEQNFDVMQQVDLSRALSAGQNRVTLAVEGDARPLFQLVSRSYVPWRGKSAQGKTVDIQVGYDRSTLRRNDVLTADVRVRSRARETLSMLIADVGLAPGFVAEPESLSALVRRRQIERFEVTPRQLILYLRDLPPGQVVRLPVRLRARFPVRAKTPPSTVYEYYNPTNRRTTPPRPLEVRM